MAKSTSPKKKKSSLDDPRAALDSAALLDAARPVLARLRGRPAPAGGSVAGGDAGAARALRGREGGRADGRQLRGVARGLLATQVAAAWLSCRACSCGRWRIAACCGQARIAGPGAMDSQRLFDQLAPSADRARLPAVRVPRAGRAAPRRRRCSIASTALVWQLSPSADAAKELLRCSGRRARRRRRSGSGRRRRASWATCTRT
jgi:hypothetical protein